MHRTQPLRAAGFVLSSLAALALSGCGQPAAQEVGLGKTGPAITAAVAIERPVAETQEFSGRIEAVERVEIRPRVSGFISAVNFRPGALVRKGDVLFVIDPRPYQAEANRLNAIARAARAKADLAQLELTRAEKLVADKAISQREADELGANFKELDATAHAAQSGFEAAKLNLGFTRVRAPIDGRASKAEVTLGNLVDSTATLTSVVSADEVYASFEGDEDTFLRVGSQSRSGKHVPVRIGLANEEGFPHTGELEFVDNRLDPATGSVRMRALFRNEDNTLAPGLFARVQLAPAGEGRSAVLVAERAVGTDQDRKFVYVLSPDSRVVYREVRLGPVIDGMRVVRHGVRAGERIVVNGLQQVQPGQAVTAQTVPMDAARAAPDAAEPGARAEKVADAQRAKQS
jgi:multidrug efflux system membrane fusion protein